MNVTANIGLALACTAALVATAIASPPAHRSHAPYAGQDAGSISSLSSEEVEGFLAGQGLGLAKPAELNGYPGPAHALELASDLKLTDVQKHAIQAAYKKMSDKAKELGARYVAAERALDGAFRAGATEAIVAERVAEAERLRAELRLVHLAAHLEIVPWLSIEQRRRYAALRGYGAAPTEN